MDNKLPRLLVCILTLLPFLSYSQEVPPVLRGADAIGTQDISISVTTLSADYLLDGYRPGRPTEFDYANKGAPVGLCLAYKLKFSPKCSIGVTETIEQQEGNWLDNETPNGVFDLQTATKGSFVRTCFTTSLDFLFDYKATDLYKFYLTTGLGFTYELETDQYNPDFYAQGYYNGVNTYGPMRQQNNRMHPNLYFSPLGLSVGRQLNYFLELGFGYKGVVNTGLSYKFNQKRK